MAGVEIMINTFERNVDRVTSPGFLAAAVRQHQFPFSVRTLLINNVDDREAAMRKAMHAVHRDEVDRFIFVDDVLPRGLALTRLRSSDFGRYLHWSDCCLAALASTGPDFLCYVDVDVTLERPVDWISQALNLMDSDPRIAVANPIWVTSEGASSAGLEADERVDGGWLGYGFSDQVFLVRRSDFSKKLRRTPSRPLWLESPASLRYPGRPGNLFFEQIVDAYMRTNHMMRATIEGARFVPVPISEYPSQGLRERLYRRRDALILDALGRMRARWPHLMSDPRLRVTGLLASDPPESR